ncbi:MAG: 4Fe-4S binding protein [Treponema sp.]|jgi:epoxyqueuosine reductase QueG|nr:4Fe-4S binding protein [Treponema sp.]
MNKNIVINEIINYTNISENNYIKEQVALKPELVGLKIFDEPLIGFADADDAYFNKLKDNNIIGNNFMSPKEWNNEARTIISIFFPFTTRIKNANKDNRDWPSLEWLHGRSEGQSFIHEICNYIKTYLENNGYKTVAPCTDNRFSSKSSVTIDKKNEKYYTSNWSERHVAYICGLGTFGLSKGLITSKGIAGRLGSLITNGYFAPDKRNYTEIYEYCNLCGKCVKNCPIHAITLEHGKIHSLCNEFLDLTREKHKPRYGCGKCQVNVSCENGIPKK